MADTLAFVVCVHGDAYERYADRLFESAARHFRPVSPDLISYVTLPARPGWPDATMYRYHVLLEHEQQLSRFRYVFMSDADMRFEGPVGPEILPAAKGVTATLHPGYVGVPVDHLPYERRHFMRAKIARPQHGVYYAGGFVGGSRDEFLRLARKIAWRIDQDTGKGHVPVWHDESALNAVLDAHPPAVTLSPAYCHPDNDAHYVANVWREPYPRLLVALDKSDAERGDRAA